MKVLSLLTDITTTTISEFSLMFDQSYSANSVYIAFKTSFKLHFKLLGKFHSDFTCMLTTSQLHLNVSPPPKSPPMRLRKKAFLEEATITPHTKS
jgi:hypothetical protein